MAGESGRKGAKDDEHSPKKMLKHKTQTVGITRKMEEAERASVRVFFKNYLE